MISDKVFVNRMKKYYPLAYENLLMLWDKEKK